MGLLIREAFWATEEEMIKLVRRTVFVKEQGVPEKLDFDDQDAGAHHVLAFAPGGSPVGTARMLEDGHIGRVAVLREFRGGGVGNLLMRELMRIAGNHSLPFVYLFSQVQAEGFYEKLGFRKCGDIFYEANIPHIKMTKVLDSQQS